MQCLCKCHKNSPVFTCCDECCLSVKENEFTLKRPSTDIRLEILEKGKELQNKINIQDNDRIKKLEAIRDSELSNESFTIYFNDNISKIYKRLDEIEKYTSFANKITASDVLSRIKEIERFIDITHEQYKLNIKKNMPHKCPVCDGYGFLHHQIVNKVDCRACGGKCVLWG